MSPIKVLIFCFFIFMFAGCAGPQHNSYFKNKELKKYALVIGNGKYQKGGELGNPVNDASAVASTLSKQGFNVKLLINADYQTMYAKTENFLVKTNHDSDVTLFYYAGHGAQFEGENYLLPVDVKLESIKDFKEHSIRLSSLLGRLHEGRSANVIILDACRNNPLMDILSQSGRSLSRSEIRGLKKASTSGLGEVNAPPNTLIAFSTAPGKIATDGHGRNSPYTGQLIESLKLENATIEQVFKNVRLRVIRETNGAQIPWESSSLTKEFSFNPQRSMPTGW